MDKEPEAFKQMPQLTQKAAVRFYDEKLYEQMPVKERALFQMHQSRLCMPFSTFQEAVEELLSRPVFTHEFVDIDRLCQEAYGHRPKPSFDDIIGMIPEEKRIVFSL